MTRQATVIDRRFAQLGMCALVLVAASLSSAFGQAPVMQTNAAGQTQVISYATGPRGPVPFVTTGNGSQITLPAIPGGGATYSRQSGLQLSVETGWPGNYGYRPVTFTLRSKKATTADSKITIKFTAGDWMPPRGKAINVEKSFTFPAGGTSVTEKVIVPRLQDWQMCTWRVEVDGRSDDFLAVDQMHLGMLGNMQYGVGAMGLGLTAQQEATCNTVLQTASNGSNVAIKMFKEQELPTDWVAYSSVDVVVMPASRLATLAEKHPKQLEAMLRWVRAGGNLWLVRAGRGWRHLPVVEQALGMGERDESVDELEDNEAALKRGWRFATIGERSLEASQGALLLANFDTGEKKTWKSVLAAVVPAGPDETSKRWFMVRGLGLGAVTAFRGDPQPTVDVSGPETTAVSQSLLGPRLGWSSRHGNQPDVSNEDFNNLLIPGVGVAPVGQFQFLITLFAIAIGPLNYWLLKRKNKLPLLLATVPAAAIGTTLLLFSYGIAADGFDVRARARTLTLLDQRAGDAVSWGRLSYYAGIAPRDGLEAPRDQLMYPIMPRWAANRYGGRATSAPRYLEWRDDQRLTRGWLASRTPTQYQAIISRPSTKQLEMRVTSEGLRIVNRLGVDVTHAGVEDHDGKFYWIEDLADGDRRVVPATDQNKLTSGIRRLFTDNLPESPGGDEIRYGVMYGNELSTSIMEGRLEAINDPAITSWGRGKYIAFTKQAVELDLCLDDVIEDSSFHVIEGSW